MITLKKPLTTFEYAILFLAVLALLAGGVIAITRLIKTERELIRERIHRGAEAVVRKDFATLEELISDRYTGEYADSKETALRRARQELQDATITSIKIRQIEITLEKDRLANVRVSFRVKGFINTDMYNNIPFKGIAGTGEDRFDEAFLTIVKEANIWRVTAFHLELRERV